MEKEFVPYRLAASLRELDYIDIFPLGYYTHGDGNFKRNYIETPLMNNAVGFTIAPTFSQAFRWFREKYGLLSWVQNMGELNPEGYTWYIQSIKGIVLNEYSEPKFKDWCMSFKSPEEAELACLIKLIELTKK